MKRAAKNMSKILFMSYCVPPIPRGPSIIIERLLRQLPDKSYGILTSRLDKKWFSPDGSRWLNCKYHHADIDTIVGGYQASLSNIFKRWFDTFSIVSKGINAIKEENYDGLLVSPTHGNFLLAAYLIHKLRGIKYYVYLFDLFRSGREPKGIDSIMNLLTEKLALMSAECIFVMSEKLQEYYHNKYPYLKLRVIRHPIDLAQYNYADKLSNMHDRPTTAPKIVFTGMIYEYQVDAMQNLAGVIRELKNIELHIYTQRGAEYLRRVGISGENIFYHGYVDNKKLAPIQKDADILFLPMSFHAAGTDPDVIRTASPSKISEYLAAAKPILIHAPSDAYVVWYAKKYGFGMVVDEPDIIKLKRAVIELVNNEELKRRVIAEASKTAHLHDISKVSLQFMRELSEGATVVVYDQKAKVSLNIIGIYLVIFWSVFIFGLYYRDFVVRLLKKIIF